MTRPDFIELVPGERIPILYEDRSVLALDKPRHWMLVPFNWQGTNRNLHAALVSSIAAGEFWARSRGLRFLRHVHRLDADTTGVLLCVKSQGAVEPFSRLFESRQMEKSYLAVVLGKPKHADWTSRLKLAPDPELRGRMRPDPRNGKEAETHFKVLETRGNRTLIEAHPRTGRTHQLRVHLAADGLPILGDALYGTGEACSVANPAPLSNSGKPRTEARPDKPLALRAVSLAYRDPFTRRLVRITAQTNGFLREFGFQSG